MTLSDRLMKITEEKTKLEFENQKLREDCIAWQNACKFRDKCINDVLEDKKVIFDERHKLAMENIELESYVSAAKRVFKECGRYIYTHRNDFAIFNFDIERLGLHHTSTRDNKQQAANNTGDDDILDLFKQSSK